MDRLGHVEIRSHTGIHLRAGASLGARNYTTLDPCLEPSSTMGGLLRGTAGLSTALHGGNVASVQCPKEETDAYWTHPAVGDCVIHLGAVPLAGEDLITRWGLPKG